MSHSSGGQTSVRFPCWTRTRPSIASACAVSRATVRLTPKRATMSSDEGNACPTAMRPDTISAARSAETWWLSRRGSFRLSTAWSSSVDDTDALPGEVEPGEVLLEQELRDVAERRRRRTEAGVGEHAPSNEHDLRAAVVVVDRVLHLEDQDREHGAEELVGADRIAFRLGLVHLHEEVDQIGAWDDPGGAGANAVEQVDATVAAPDRELGPQARDPLAHLHGTGLELDEPHVLCGGGDARHDAGTEPDAEVGRRILDHRGDRHRRGHTHEVVDQGRLVEGAAHRSRQHDAA